MLLTTERVEFSAVPPAGICWGFWREPQRTLNPAGTAWDTSWGPCQKPLGHLGNCGPRWQFDAEVYMLGERGCHVVEPGQQSLFT